MHELEHSVTELVPVLGRIEIVLERGDELLRHAQLALVERAPARRLERRNGHHLAGVAQRDQREVVALGAQRAGVRLLPHHPARDALALLLRERARQREVGALVIVGAEEVRPIVPLVRDRAGRHEAGDLDRAGGLGLQGLELVVIDQDVDAALDLEAAAHVFVFDHLARHGIDHALLHRLEVLLVQEAKVHPAFLHRRVQLDGHLDVFEADDALPDRPRHPRPPCGRGGVAAVHEADSVRAPRVTT